MIDYPFNYLVSSTKPVLERQFQISAIWRAIVHANSGWRNNRFNSVCLSTFEDYFEELDNDKRNPYDDLRSL
ncbi:hypothetical protein [Rhizobium sp. PL01]|uniref:hypothetical protein n=1 Tax=Rhizobium sp. PL01 TaxID=3085631 RepID=UPI002981BBB0|nr:hypothetical protein [Rhizobium sp. PL01]MDW5318487.1 hypothetical protein [Rhizobium sp. PL01]